MARYGIGTRQREVLDAMVRWGGGYWKANWHTTFKKREILDSLVAKGVLVKVDAPEGIYKINTEEGETR